jgi:hypothetical protein
MGMTRTSCGRERAGFLRRQRRLERLRSPRPLHRPGPARSARTLRAAALLGLRPAVLAGSGTGAAASPFESARTAGPSVGGVSLVPPQPPAVLAALRASALARLDPPGGRQVSGRHEVARGEPAAGRQRTPVGLTGLARTSRVADWPVGSADRKRAGALSGEAASDASVPEHPGGLVSGANETSSELASDGARAGRCGATATHWNHHARALAPDAEPWRTSEGEPSEARRTTEVAARAGPQARAGTSSGWRGRSSVPRRRKDRRPSAARPRTVVRDGGAVSSSRKSPIFGDSEPRGHERPRASVAFPSPSHTPVFRQNSADSDQNQRLITEDTT